LFIRSDATNEVKVGKFSNSERPIVIVFDFFSPTNKHFDDLKESANFVKIQHLMSVKRQENGYCCSTIALSVILQVAEHIATKKTFDATNLLLDYGDVCFIYYWEMN
jgi:hypothetical protein